MQNNITKEDISESVFNSDDRVYELQLQRIQDEDLKIGDFITVRCIEDIGELFGRNTFYQGFNDEWLESKKYILNRSDIEDIARS
jgi:hypothetical protein